MQKNKRLGLLLMLGRRIVLCMEFKKNYSLKSILIAKKKKKRKPLLSRNASLLLRGKISKAASHKQSLMFHY